MSEKDDLEAEAYLKSVLSIKRRRFKKGFVCVNHKTLNKDNTVNNINANSMSANKEERHHHLLPRTHEEKAFTESDQCKWRLPVRKRKREYVSDNEASTTEHTLSDGSSCLKCHDEKENNNNNNNNIINENISESHELEMSCEEESTTTVSHFTTTVLPLNCIDAPARFTQTGTSLLSKILASEIRVGRQESMPVSYNPPILFIESTISRVTSARERFIFLRGAVEDMSMTLKELSSKCCSEPKHKYHTKVEESNLLVMERWNNQLETNHKWIQTLLLPNMLTKCCSLSISSVLSCVNESTLEYVKEQIANNFGPIECCSLREVRRLLIEMIAKEHSCESPRSNNVKLWHQFISDHGPNTGHLPSLTNLLWLSSVNTTTFFTTLVQRLLREFQEACKCYGTEVENELRNAYSEYTGKTTNDEMHSLKEEQEKNCTEEHTNNRDTTYTRSEKMFDDTAINSEKYILLFLQHLMPSVSYTSLSENNVIQHGYGIWLFALCIALDTPLDPDTDRLVHELFAVLCKVIRWLGEYKQINGSERGMLLNAFSSALPRNKYKCYNKMENVNRDDVLAVYTFIIIFAKFFRQNQNRIIDLSVD